MATYRYRKFRKNVMEPSYLRMSDEAFRIKIERSTEMLSHCRLCPRKCSVNRLNGERGFCRQSDVASVSHFLPHRGEEPLLVSGAGAGTVFFKGCTMSCVFCQNYQISSKFDESRLSDEELADVFLTLQNNGCSNLDLVTPTPHIPAIVRSLYIAKKSGFSLPVVYNTNSYMTEDAFELICDFVDIYLADLKYFSDNAALKYSSAPFYSENAKRTLISMAQKRGVCLKNENGELKKGCIVRILLLPDGSEEAEKTLSFLADSSIFVPVSIMGQYEPLYRAAEYAGMSCNVSEERVMSVVRFAEALGFEDVMFQLPDSACCLVPDFSKKNIFS